MKHRIFTVIIAIALVCVLLISCNDIVPPESSVPPNTSSPSLPDLSFPDESIYINVSDGDDVSDTDVSVPTETSVSETSEPDQTDESSVPEVSTVVEEYIWYGQKEIDDWFRAYLLGVAADPDERTRGDGKHYAYYYNIDGSLMTYINEKAGSSIFADEYLKLFEKTADINISALCEYYGITKEEYVAYYSEFIEEFGKSKEGEIPPYLMFRLPSFRYDTIFSEEYWNHSDYLVNDYVAPEIDDHYTSLKDRNGYTKRYYIIDRRLIEYVGVEQFEEWLDSASDTEQNIIEFIDHFGITREIYEDIYRETCYIGPPNFSSTDWRYLPYNPDYLFGTPEMQEEYFTVHPLN